MNTTDGFDLGPVLAWLTANEERVARQLSWITQLADDYSNVVGMENVQIRPSEITKVLSLFQGPAQERSVLRNIVGKPPTWFAVGTTSDRPIPTEDRLKAMCPTAIVPGYTDIVSWTPEKKVSDIWLYRIPEVPDRIATFMLVHALIHEYSHTILNPLWFCGKEPYVIDVPGCTEYTGEAFMMMFAHEAAKHDPISHYAAAYRPFPDDPSDKQFIRNVGEELCESVAAYFMGFIYCNDPVRCWAPFAGRPIVKLLVEHFLRGVHKTD
ncbi:MAG: hypothetical protein KGI49_02310 [Patescibacteria group bacterium]|nr:hypothetical protein [Patescibacteria group bacterium]